MMESNSNMLAMSNVDENGNVPPINHLYWDQPQNQPVSYETKTALLSVQQQQQQQHSRKPFQTLNSNTSANGTFHHDMFRPDTSKPTKPLKMAKFHQYTKAAVNVEKSTFTVNDVADEESSTISANENTNNTEKCERLQDVFRRRLDASDENMEQFWIIKSSNPIDESDDEVEETEE